MTTNDEKVTRTCGNCGKKPCSIHRIGMFVCDEWTPEDAKQPAPVARQDIPDKIWRKVQEETKTDILSIVMNLVSGRTNASQTMEAIASHCEAVYRQANHAAQDIMDALEDEDIIESISKDYEGMSARWIMHRYRAAVKERL
jgi:hypothetical protein